LLIEGNGGPQGQDQGQTDVGWWGWLFGDGGPSSGTGGHSDLTDTAKWDERSSSHHVTEEEEVKKEQQSHEGASDTDPSKFCFRRAPAPSEGAQPVERKGQVTDETTFGSALRNLASRDDVRRILEIGTWYGGGSTDSFVRGLRDKQKSDCDVLEDMQCCDSFVITFEIDTPAWDHARRYHRNNPVWFVHGTTVGVEDMLTNDQIPLEERGEHYDLYYERDRELMEKESPQLAKYCAAVRPDVVLIDGNEYTGWGEFNVAVKRCRPRYVALHDTGTLKTRRVEEEIRRRPDAFELVEAGTDAVGWGLYRLNYDETPREGSFRVIVLTSTKYESLQHLLESLNQARYGNTYRPLHLEIHIDHDDSSDHTRTVDAAESFDFDHGTKSIRRYASAQGRRTMWFKAWNPTFDDERAVVLEDALQLSPVWYEWLERAWDVYGDRPDLGAISLCRQRLRATDGAVVTREAQTPFLHRVPGSHGFSPSAAVWREFVSWIRNVGMDDLKDADVDVEGTVTTQWHRDGLDTWEQYWVWWCWGNSGSILGGTRALYNLYVHPPDASSLIRHEADFDAVPLQQSLLPPLTLFPERLDKFDWAFELESSNGAFSFLSKFIPRAPSVKVVRPDNNKKSPPAASMRYDSDSLAELKELKKTSSVVVVWSNDFHVSTIGNVKSLLRREEDVRFIDKSLSGHCDKVKTCATDLRVLNAENGINPDRWTRDEFYEAYRADPEMDIVDVVMCFHPSAMCELFLPLRKRLFVVATTRYEMGRHTPEEWTEWNRNLKRIAGGGRRNVVAANNLYDAKYIEYFTGIRPAVLPSWKPLKATYAGTSNDIVVADMHASEFSIKLIWDELRSVSSPNHRFVELREKYATYKFSQLCQNTAILHLPYQVSIMSMFEQYGMGIPILVPSPEFLWELHERYTVVTERTWHYVKNLVRPSSSDISGAMSGSVPDPNNDLDKGSFLHWIRYADYYQWPHIVTFDSWDDLGRVIDSTDWKDVSAKMKVYYDDALARTKEDWKERLRYRGWFGGIFG